MSDPFPAEIRTQLAAAIARIERHLADTLQAVHLYGSAVDGGLRPLSDVDLLVTVSRAPAEGTRRALMLDLLEVSAPPGTQAARRALEVTVVALSELKPWRHPARRVLQFGEWLRPDLLAGRFEPPMADIDLAILITKARQHGVALRGPAAQALFDPVPAADLARVLADTPKQWNDPSDWMGDERNVLLTLARLCYTAATGEIAPKEVAAQWLIARLPPQHRPVLEAALSAHLQGHDGDWAAQADGMAAFVAHARAMLVPADARAPARRVGEDR